MYHDYQYHYQYDYHYLIAKLAGAGGGGLLEEHRDLLGLALDHPELLIRLLARKD